MRRALRASRAPALLVALLVARAPEAFAGPGVSGAGFLNFGQGPRASGMGESHAAVAEDPYAAYWNPAGLAAIEHPTLAMSYSKGLESVDQQYLSFAYPLRLGSTLDLNVTRLQMSGFDGYDALGARTRTVEAGAYALGLAYGRALRADESGRPTLSMGAGLKTVRESLGGVSARTFAGDLGVLAVRRRGRPGAGPKSEWRAGFSIRHWGPGLEYDGGRSELPTVYQLGLAWRGFPKGDQLTFSLDPTLSREDSLYLGTGAEYVVLRTVSLRLGYRSGQDIGSGFRAGVGFHYKVFDLDYAFASFGELGPVHRVGVTVRLGGPIEITSPEERGLEAVMQKAARLMSERRYYEALMEYNKALDLDPGNRRALEGMRSASQKLRR